MHTCSDKHSVVKETDYRSSYWRKGLWFLNQQQTGHFWSLGETINPKMPRAPVKGSLLTLTTSLCVHGSCVQ